MCIEYEEYSSLFVKAAAAQYNRSYLRPKGRLFFASDFQLSAAEHLNKL